MLMSLVLEQIFGEFSNFTSRNLDSFLFMQSLHSFCVVSETLIACDPTPSTAVFKHLLLTMCHVITYGHILCNRCDSRMGHLEAQLLLCCAFSLVTSIFPKEKLIQMITLRQAFLLQRYQIHMGQRNNSLTYLSVTKLEDLSYLELFQPLRRK